MEKDFCTKCRKETKAIIIPEYIRFEAGKYLEQYIDIIEEGYSYSSEPVILNGLHLLIQNDIVSIKELSRELSKRTGRMVTTGMIEEWVEVASKRWGSQ